MPKTCDFCKKKLGIRKRKYKEGYTCKVCYYIVSNQYRDTIRYKSKRELDSIYKRYQLKYENVLKEDFEITTRIGNYLLIDEKNHKICIPNNISTVGKDSTPQFVSFDHVRNVQIICAPFNLNNQKSKNLSHSLSVKLTTIKQLESCISHN